MKRRLILKAVGKAKHVFAALRLLAQEAGNMTLGEIVRERGRNNGS